MSGKRYYWLKLKDDFFTSKRIKKLRKLAGGDTYTIIYLKMQLLAMKKEGILEYTGLEKTFEEELALDLDEEPDDIRVTLNYLLSCGLAECSDDANYYFPYAVENVGTEGSSAKRVRELRERRALQCNTDVTRVKQNCNGEKEIEKREREKSKSKREEAEGGAPALPAQSDPGLARVMRAFLDTIPEASPHSLEKLKAYYEELGAELCERAIYIARDERKARWSYIEAIMKRYAQDGIRTLADLEQHEVKRDREKDAANSSAFAPGEAELGAIANLKRLRESVRGDEP